MATARAAVGRGIGGLGSLVGLVIEVPGGERVHVALSRFGEDVDDWTEFWTDWFAPKFLVDVERNFETEGGFVGGWTPLSPDYAAWKAEKFPGKKILELRGSLKGSLTWEESAIGPEGVFRPSKDELEIGTSIPYARYHQFGTRRMPKRRPLFAVSSSTYGRLLHRYLVARAAAAKLPVTETVLGPVIAPGGGVGI